MLGLTPFFVGFPVLWLGLLTLPLFRPKVSSYLVAFTLASRTG